MTVPENSGIAKILRADVILSSVPTGKNLTSGQIPNHGMIAPISRSGLIATRYFKNRFCVEFPRKSGQWFS
jgi:hypothetical protein